MFKALILVVSILLPTLSYAEQTQTTDDMYRALIKSVKDNDFSLMASLYHPDAVIVSKDKNELASKALIRWETEGQKLHAEGGYASLQMRFKNRVTTQGSSFESGIYHYRTVDQNRKVTDYYAHFEDLNVLKDGKWLIMMERNVKQATSAEFERLPAWE